MAFIWHDAGESWGLQVLFSGAQGVATTFGLGLCSDTLVESDTIATLLAEPTTGGYSRQLLSRATGDWTVTKTDPVWTAQAAVKSWTAVGGNIGTVNTWFITNEGVSGSLGGSAFLLASGPISPERTINSGDTLNLTSYLTLA